MYVGAVEDCSKGCVRYLLGGTTLGEAALLVVGRPQALPYHLRVV